jgi:hypothetical protein
MAMAGQSSTVLACVAHVAVLQYFLANFLTFDLEPSTYNLAPYTTHPSHPQRTKRAANAQKARQTAVHLAHLVD